MSNTDAIKKLIDIRDQLTGEAADIIQEAIDGLVDELEAGWASSKENIKPIWQEMQDHINLSNIQA